MNKIRLRRVAPGLYRAMVRIAECSGEPFELTVLGPDPDPTYRNEFNSTGYRWFVEGADTLRYFDKLADARAYINRFFEAA